MLSSLALMLVLAQGQDAPLEIANARATYGYLGGAIKSKDGRLPGDIVHFSFDIKNLKLDDNARASYAMMVEVLNDKGRTQFKLGPVNSVAQNYLGGNSMPCSAQLDIPVDTPPGVYVFRVTVMDRANDAKVVFERKGKVRSLDFGLVQVATYADRDSKVPAPQVSVVGGMLFVHFAAVGFARDKSTKQPDLQVSLRVLDDNGKATFPKALTGEVTKDVPEEMHVVPLQFGLTLNRVGDFTIELEANDRAAGKSSKVQLPLKVVPLN